MANIPTGFSTREAAALPGVQARAEVVSGAADIFGPALTATAELGARLQREELERDVTGLQIQYQRDLLDFETSLQGRNDYANFERDYATFNQQWSERNLANVAPRTSQAFEPTRAGLELKGLASVRNNARTTQIDESKATLSADITKSMETYTFASDDQGKLDAAAGAMDAINARERNGVITASEAQALREKTILNFARADVQSALHSGPAAIG